MTIGEAHDVNTILDYLLADSEHGTPPDHDAAKQAAARLADRACHALGSGWAASDVITEWDRRDIPALRPASDDTPGVTP